MQTLPELLRHDLRTGERATIVLRSGIRLTGVLHEVDLTTYVLRLGTWVVRVDEVAAVGAATPSAA